jgi:hypothetical protein
MGGLAALCSCHARKSATVFVLIGQLSALLKKVKIIEKMSLLGGYLG